ncbi:MAG TPA: DUF2288 family protein [Luteolibacter sp.]
MGKSDAPTKHAKPGNEQSKGNRYSSLGERNSACHISRVISLDSPDASFSENHESTREKLANYTGQVPWSYLAPHALKGSLYFVDSALKLEDVGEAISENQADQVAEWLKAGDLVKIEAIHAAQWENSETEFEALVVTPFVLCRPI